MAHIEGVSAQLQLHTEMLIRSASYVSPAFRAASMIATPEAS